MLAGSAKCDCHLPETIVATGNYQGSVPIKVNLGVKQREEKLTLRSTQTRLAGRAPYTEPTTKTQTE